MIGTFDAVGGYRLLLSGLPSSNKHFVEAASPCLARLSPVWLRPFRGTQQVFTSLSAPLTGDARNWVKAQDAAFLRDVLRLTGGNPYEVMLVGHHLWSTCARGEQDAYVLSPRVLDRIIPNLSLLASGGDALLDGAAAIDRLPEEHVRQAVDLVALERLTVRQIAIARLLKVDSRDADRLDRDILTADVAAATERVVSELSELEMAGVVQLRPDRDRFDVVGGRPAAVLLKYMARARIGAEKFTQPFSLNYLLAVGRALARDAATRTSDGIVDAKSLGFSTIMSQDGAGRLSPRPANRTLAEGEGFERLIQAELQLIPWDKSRLDRVTDLLAEGDPSIAFVYNAVAYDREVLEYTELWVVPHDVSHETIAGAWSAVVEDWQPVVAAADMSWIGSEFAVLRGSAARQALVILQRYSATTAVSRLFERWWKSRDPPLLSRAQEIADEAVETMRTTGLSETELAGELSGMLSRTGFLKSLAVAGVSGGSRWAAGIGESSGDFAESYRDEP